MKVEEEIIKLGNQVIKLEKEREELEKEIDDLFEDYLDLGKELLIWQTMFELFFRYVHDKDCMRNPCDKEKELEEFEKLYREKAELRLKIKQGLEDYAKAETGSEVIGNEKN